jgi:hypothetical protein
MALELFDLVKTMFTDPKKYKELKNSDKARHHFMIQRFMAIKFPSTAQQLNRNGINGWAVIDLWSLVALRFKGKVPGWIYTKTKKAQATEKKWKPDADLAKFWMQRTGTSQRDLDDCIKFNPEEMKALFSNLAKQIKQDE